MRRIPESGAGFYPSPFLRVGKVSIISYPPPPFDPVPEYHLVEQPYHTITFFYSTNHLYSGSPMSAFATPSVNTDAFRLLARNESM